MVQKYSTVKQLCCSISKNNYAADMPGTQWGAGWGLAGGPLYHDTKKHGKITQYMTA